MKIFNKNYNMNEILLGAFLFVLIVMTMNKTIPEEIENVIMSFQGMFVSLLFLLVVFFKFNSVVGILLVIFLYLLFSKMKSKPHAKPHTQNIMNKPKEINHVKKNEDKKSYKSLEEEIVHTMLPIANENNVSQLKYTASSSSSELYASV